MLTTAGETVAVRACDPESALTGGALLGDRVRMAAGVHGRVFIRSLPVCSGRQAIAERLDVMIDLLKAFGFEVILVETVGAGQGDTAVREVVDLIVLLVQPEAGDELQWQKAGLLEVADVVVVHKADLLGAERAEQELREMLNLPGCRKVPVVRASAAKNDGINKLWDVIQAVPDA